MNALTLVVELRFLALALLLSVCVLVALFTRCPTRRRVALDLVALLLTPMWRRGGPSGTRDGGTGGDTGRQ